MIALLGYGKTNQALLDLLNSRGETCLIFDDALKQDHQDQQSNLFLPSAEREKFSPSLEIPSPGIPPYHPLIQKASNLVSEYDFLLDGVEQQIWISGTNGKTSTTEMLEYLLRDKGGVSGGNIGTPLAKLSQVQPKIWILETSSFSLHYSKRVFPKIYLLLPVREDHISWHGSFEAYVEAKLSPLKRMETYCKAIIPKEFSQRAEVLDSRAEIFFYKDSSDLAHSFGFNIGTLGFSEPFLLDALLALSGAKLLGYETLSLAGFKIGAHKIEELHDAWGRLWVDDSKGTNADASIWALRAYRGKKIFLILGGDDKGADLKPLFEEMRGMNLEIFGIGSNTRRLQELAYSFNLPFSACFELHHAITLIHAKHDLSSIALLSPAAASLDQFSSYKERGEKFQELVRDLHIHYS